MHANGLDALSRLAERFGELVHRFLSEDAHTPIRGSRTLHATKHDMEPRRSAVGGPGSLALPYLRWTGARPTAFLSPSGTKPMGA